MSTITCMMTITNIITIMITIITMVMIPKRWVMDMGIITGTVITMGMNPRRWAMDMGIITGMVITTGRSMLKGRTMDSTMNMSIFMQNRTMTMNTIIMCIPACPILRH